MENGQRIDQGIRYGTKSPVCPRQCIQQGPVPLLLGKILLFRGCNANNQEYEGDILKAHTLSCELEKKRLECAIMIKAALADAAG